MALIEFVEEQLDLCIDYGANGGPRFDTSVVTVHSGIDYRNSNWDIAKGRWEIGDRVVSRPELDQIMNFFLRRRGAAVGFRFKDWGDFQVKQQKPVQLTPVEYQLQKVYGADDLHAYKRQILKPVNGTAKVFLNNSELLFGWSISSTTGVLKFDTPPVGNVLVDFEFDKAARFDVDEFNHEFQAYDEHRDLSLFSMTSIPVIELRDNQIQ